jgi:hypothetical protein
MYVHLYMSAFMVTSQQAYKLMPVPLCSTYILHGGGGEYNKEWSLNMDLQNRGMDNFFVKCLYVR